MLVTPPPSSPHARSCEAEFCHILRASKLYGISELNNAQRGRCHVMRNTMQLLDTENAV